MAELSSTLSTIQEAPVAQDKEKASASSVSAVYLRPEAQAAPAPSMPDRSADNPQHPGPKPDRASISARLAPSPERDSHQVPFTSGGEDIPAPNPKCTKTAQTSLMRRSCALRVWDFEKRSHQQDTRTIIFVVKVFVRPKTSEKDKTLGNPSAIAE